MTVLRRAGNTLVLLGYFVVELFRTTFEIAHMVATPGVAEAAVVSIQLHTRNPWTITTFANLVSLTPGSLTLEVADDRSALYVYALATRSLEDLREDLDELQQRVLKVMP